MINLGNVVADSTIRIPFNSFDAAGASVTMSDFVAGDIKIYKDGGTTERSSTNGYTATTDFDGNTGMHVAVIDLSDNTDVGFYALNSAYDVAVDAVTIDGETVRFWVGKFAIENAKVGSKIKSVQDVQIAITSGNVSAAATINAVDWDKTELRLRGFRVSPAASAGGLASCLIGAYHTSSTTVRIIREGTSGAVNGYLDVVEWE